MSNPTKGILALLACTVIWGMSSLFYAQLKHVPPLEVLSHRSLWSLIFFSAVLLWQGRLHHLWQAVDSPRKFGVIFLASGLIAANWFGFIFAIQAGFAVEASLGYYIFPMVAVLLGRFVLGETLTRGQWVAVGLALAAVLVLTLGLGVPPWISLWLAFTFGLYGLVKKRLMLGPVVSVTAEVLVLLPLVVVYLVGWHSTGLDWQTYGLLAFSGILTGTPLILFAYASQRVRLSTIGILQYVNPTLQFLIATLVFLEPFTLWHQIAFPMIWVGIVIYSVTAIRQERASRKALSSASTVGTNLA